MRSLGQGMFQGPADRCQAQEGEKGHKGVDVHLTDQLSGSRAFLSKSIPTISLIVPFTPWPSSQVHVELLGSGLTLSQALPREKGTFQRGSVERFSIELEAGRDLGEVLAIKVGGRRA